MPSLVLRSLWIIKRGSFVWQEDLGFGAKLTLESNFNSHASSGNLLNQSLSFLTCLFGSTICTWGLGEINEKKKLALLLHICWVCFLTRLPVGVKQMPPGLGISLCPMWALHLPAPLKRMIIIGSCWPSLGSLHLLCGKWK